MSKIRERFSEIHTHKANTFLRVSETHPLDLYVGLDSQNFKALKYRGEYSPNRISSTALIQVQQFQGMQYNTLVFSLLDDSAESIFFQLCQDLVDITNKIDDPQTGYRILRDRYYQWKRLFVNSNRDPLSEIAIMGLIGELYFLKNYMIPRYGQRTAIQGWSGQDETHKDFSYADDWYEIKAQSDHATTVKISSLEQLDSDSIGTLVVFKMEKMSPESSGIRINQLVRELLDSVSEIELKDMLLDKITSQGYAIKDEYDVLVFELRECLIYSVSDAFPKLIKQNVPNAIVKAAYDIALADIIQYRRAQI